MINSRYSVHNSSRHQLLNLSTNFHIFSCYEHKQTNLGKPSNGTAARLDSSYVYSTRGKLKCIVVMLCCIFKHRTLCVCVCVNDWCDKPQLGMALRQKLHKCEVWEKRNKRESERRQIKRRTKGCWWRWKILKLQKFENKADVHTYFSHTCTRVVQQYVTIIAFYVGRRYQRSRCALVNWISNVLLHSGASPCGDGFDGAYNSAPWAGRISGSIICRSRWSKTFRSVGIKYWRNTTLLWLTVHTESGCCRGGSE